VPHTQDLRITTITNSVVLETSALLAESLDVWRNSSRRGINWSEGMGWVVSVFSVLEAQEAKIKVGTLLACDERGSTKFCRVSRIQAGLTEGRPTNDAAVARSLIVVNSMFECNRWGLQLLLGSQSLGVACVDSAILDRPLDQPVILITTGDTSVDAGRAQVEISRFALAAVVVLVCNRLVAVVAIYAKGCATEIVKCGQGWHAKHWLRRLLPCRLHCRRWGLHRSRLERLEGVHLIGGWV